MKKRMKTILSLLFVAFLYSSVQAQAPVNLKYNLELNKTYRLKSSNTLNQKTSMYGNEQLTEVKNVSYFSIKALKNAPDFFMAQVKFDTIMNSTSMPKMEMTSANPGNMKSENPVEISNCFLNRMANSTFLVKMDYSGHVIDIMNYDVIAKVLLADVDSLQGQIGASVKPRLVKMSEKETLKGMIEAITAYLPNKEIAKGEKWTTNYKNSAGGFGMLYNMDYKLDDLQGNSAKLSSAITIEPAGDKPMEVNGSEITSDMRGLGEAQMTINPATGWIENGTSKVHLGGNLTVKAQGQEFQIPTEIDAEGELTVINQ